MSIFEVLEKKQRKRSSFEHSEEYAYYNANKSKLKNFSIFPYLIKSGLDEFNIIRANIILQGLENKEIIEKEVENINRHFDGSKESNHEQYILTLKERMVGYPYLIDNNIKIFIPFFPKALNSVYSRQPEKLLKEPFLTLKDSYLGTLIDPFDTYGIELYNSTFTRLIKCGERDNEFAFFHYDTNTIYIINEQGRLDNKIVLFDKYIKEPNYNYMLKRITPVIEAYFDYDRSKFVQELLNNNFISKRMFSMIRKQRK